MGEELAKLNLRVVYRNYIPLNSPYSSFWTNPPNAITFDIPKVKSYLKYLYPVYRRFSDWRLVRAAIHYSQSFIFSQANEDDAADAYLYIGILPSETPGKPFYVDIEHGVALLNFIDTDEKKKSLDRIMTILTHPFCKGIIPISCAADRSLQHVLGTSYEEIAGKVRVIYPALPPYRELNFQHDESIIGSDSMKGDFNVLFVGREPIGKGLYELLDAWHLDFGGRKDANLYVVTHADKITKAKASKSRSVQLFEPRFSTTELMSKLMLRVNVFVMPTHLDSFGMVFLEALACGKPIVATRQFATPEIVREGLNGVLLTHDPLFLDRPDPIIPKHPQDLGVESQIYTQILDGLRQKLSYFYNNRDELVNMSEHALEDFKNMGKFSVNKRNKDLTDLMLN